jgi:hypothetical protein
MHAMLRRKGLLEDAMVAEGGYAQVLRMATSG